MEKFELDKAKGVLKKCTTAKKKSKDDDKLVLTNDVHLLIVVDKRCRDAAEYLVPGHEFVEKQVAARDGSHTGLEIQTKGDVEELNVVIYDGTGNNEVFRFERIGLMGRPKMLINSLGDSRLALRLNAKLSKKDMGKLVDYIDADVYVSAEVSQPLLPGMAKGKAISDAIEATQPLNGNAPTQPNLDGTLDGDGLRTLRENAGMSRPEFVEFLAEKDVIVAIKSLQRYENGDRPMPDEFAQSVKEIYA